MKKAQELIDIINKNDLLKPLFEDDFYDVELEDEEGNSIENVKEYIKTSVLGELEYKDSRHDTSEFWQVIYFKDHDIYLRIDGVYDSYGQYEHKYNSVKEVKPVEKTITVFE
jgi:hypothetical protein